MTKEVMCHLMEIVEHVTKKVYSESKLYTRLYTEFNLGATRDDKVIFTLSHFDGNHLKEITFNVAPSGLYDIGKGFTAISEAITSAIDDASHQSVEVHENGVSKIYTSREKL